VFFCLVVGPVGRRWVRLVPVPACGGLPLAPTPHHCETTNNAAKKIFTIFFCQTRQKNVESTPVCKMDETSNGCERMKKEKSDFQVNDL